MARIGDWWLARCEAWPGETVEWWCCANRTHSPNRAVGGKLILTNRRLIFLPHRLDYWLAAKKWDASITEIKAVVRHPRGGRGLTGLSDRMRIELEDGSAALFLVSRPDDPATLHSVLHRLRQAIGQSRPEAADSLVVSPDSFNPLKPELLFILKRLAVTVSAVLVLAWIWICLPAFQGAKPWGPVEQDVSIFTVGFVAFVVALFVQLGKGRWE